MFISPVFFKFCSTNPNVLKKEKNGFNYHDMQAFFITPGFENAEILKN